MKKLNLRYVMLKHIADRLAANEGNRTKTAKEVGVSIRTVRNMINEMEEWGIKVKKLPPIKARRKFW